MRSSAHFFSSTTVSLSNVFKILSLIILRRKGREKTTEAPPARAPTTTDTPAVAGPAGTPIFAPIADPKVTDVVQNRNPEVDTTSVESSIADANDEPTTIAINLWISFSDNAIPPCDSDQTDSYSFWALTAS